MRPLERTVQHVQGKVNVFRSNAEWRLDTEHIAVQTTLAEQDPHFTGSLQNLERRAGSGSAGFRVRQLDTEHESQPSDVTHQTVLPLKFLQTFQKSSAHYSGVLLQILLVDHIEYGKT